MTDIRVSFDAVDAGVPGFPPQVKVTLTVNGVPAAAQMVSADNLGQFLQKPDGNYTIYLTEPS